MPNNRCSAVVLDKETKRNRKCKKTFKFTINGCKYCTIHLNIALCTYVLLIQSIYRGKVVRRRVNYIKSMPDDIQQKIISFEREEFFNEIFNYKLSNFLIKKFRIFITNFIIDINRASPDMVFKALSILYLRKKYIAIIQINFGYYSNILLNRYFYKTTTIKSELDNIQRGLIFKFKYDTNFVANINLMPEFVDYCLY